MGKKRRKIRIRGLNGLLGRVIARLVQAWMSTIRYRVVYQDPLTDPVYHTDQQRIYLVWHEHLLTPVYLRPHSGVAILISQHRDADILEAIAHASGFECVRGSTNRGGAAALKKLTECGQTNHIVITPDGPRGPRREIAPGSIFLAGKLDKPIVPLGVAYDRCWRMPTWDQFAVPVPFTTARLFLGSEMSVQPGLDREGLESRRVEIQREMMRLTQQAEAWAATKRSRPDAVPARRERPQDPPEELTRPQSKAA